MVSETQNVSSMLLGTCFRLDMEDVPISSLARESRLVLVLFGRSLQAPESGDKESTPQYKQEEIGWTSVQFFNYEG